MPRQKVLEQHIAVFGESGSGKTVLLSSFYGSEQEPANIRTGTFNLVAENHGQGTRLHQNYLGMKKSATVPDATKFSAEPYRFLLRLKGSANTGPLQAKPFDALRLVWHDYPGEWFEQGPSGDEEARRRVETFRALLGSHVALLLVDGQKLLEHAGEEERYLKSLFGNVRNTLLLIRDHLVEDDTPLASFPRIWVIALSKADLLPDLDVQAFKELIIERVGRDVIELRDVLASLVESSDALSVGDDYVRISSAKFSPGAIEVTDRVGVDLVLPMAAVLPLERHVRWAAAEKLSRRVAGAIVGNAELVAAGLGAATNVAAILIGKKNKVAGAVGLALARLGPRLEDAIKEAGKRLEAADQVATTKRDNLAATLHGFRDDLDQAEQHQVLSRSAG
ncbi:TRAFAC clade GTPase domain-containing protein [Nocardioides marmoraquaticus]